jgi:hypothetical protein
MGRREIIGGCLITVLAAGLAAATTGAVTQTKMGADLVWFGAIVSAIAATALLYMAIRPTFLAANGKSQPEIREVTTVGRAPVANAAVGVGSDRVFLSREFTPSVLTDKIVGKTSIQIAAIEKPHVGKWMQVSGKVHDVSRYFNQCRLFMNRW